MEHTGKFMKEEMSSRTRASHHDADSDAERESVHAWQLQRSPSQPPPPCVTEKETTEKGNISNIEIDVSMSSDAQYCYYILEAMPQPGPTWSTTAPSILAEPTTPKSTPTLTAPIEAPVKLEWGECQDFSCNWWMGYLDGLDDNIMTIEKLDPPFVENIVMENSKGLSYEPSFVDSIDLSYSCPDDWLVIPTMEQDFGDIVMP